MKSNKLAAEAVIATGEALRAAAAKYAAATNTVNAARYEAEMAHDDYANKADTAVSVIYDLRAAWVEYIAAEEAAIAAYAEAQKINR